VIDRMGEYRDPVLLGVTESVCPRCLTRIQAQKVKYGERVYLEKYCAEHGFFRVLIWNGPPSYESWGFGSAWGRAEHCLTRVDAGCPYDCGLCPDHRRQTCCVLLEVTQKCSLACPVCFSSSGKTVLSDPSLEEIAAWYETLMQCGGPFNIQLSGGEPTERNDLPAIIELGREKGFAFFQLNTNGLRLAAEGGYAVRLREAGLNCAFLQFDGLAEETYLKLRGKRLLAQKQQAIENAAKAGLGVVLVPTLVPGVNDREIGAILHFAVEHMPAVRGVHFQPISYFGRCGQPPDKRLTIPDVLRAIEEQTAGKIKAESFYPGSTENAYCSFNSSFVVLANGEIRPWKLKNSGGASRPGQTAGEEPRKAQAFVAKHWSGANKEEVGDKEAADDKEAAAEKKADGAAPAGAEPGSAQAYSLEEFLFRLKNYSLAVSGMAFQDAWNLDLERLRECYIHVVSPDKRIIPFCAYNLSAVDGKTLYRGRGR